MAKVPNAVETLPKVLTGWVGCTNVTDDRQTTDWRATAYRPSERELAFTFARNRSISLTPLAFNRPDGRLSYMISS